MRAIVVDDNQVLCETLTCFLEQEGFLVRGFTDPNEALTHCALNSVDVMIVDLRMPAMDGLELVEKVKVRQPSVRVIMVTGNYLDGLRIARAVARRKIDSSLEKPFELTALVDSILCYPRTHELKPAVALGR